MIEPYIFGDVRNIVAELHLDRKGPVAWVLEVNE